MMPKTRTLLGVIALAVAMLFVTFSVDARTFRKQLGQFGAAFSKLAASLAAAVDPIFSVQPEDAGYSTWTGDG